MANPTLPTSTAGSIPVPPPIQVEPPLVDAGIPPPPPAPPLEFIPPAPPTAPPLFGAVPIAPGVPSASRKVGFALVPAQPKLSPQEKHIKREVARLEKEMRMRANALKYYSAREPRHAETLLRAQIEAWTQVKATPERVNDIAQRQLKLIENFFGGDAVLHEPKKVIDALPKYTNEELALLLVIFKTTCSSIAQNTVFDQAEADMKKVSPNLSKLYLADNNVAWGNTFFQYPEMMRDALCTEMERRLLEKVIVKYEPVPYVESADQKDTEEEQKKVDLIAEIAKRQEATATKGNQPYKTFRKPKSSSSSGATPVQFTKLKPVKERSTSSVSSPPEPNKGGGAK